MSGEPKPLDLTDEQRRCLLEDIADLKRYYDEVDADRRARTDQRRSTR